jgi:type II restriction/modification system DNA methylase subunit YeeA
MERAAAQEHFLDLCSLLGEPTPNSDPTGESYAFEKGATKANGGNGWADVWRRGCFAWEYKGKHKDLDAARRQLLQYTGALENPPLLVMSDIERIVIRGNWTNAVAEERTIALGDLIDARQRDILKWVFSDPDRLRPTRTRAALTAAAATEFAELARRLRARGHAPQAVAHFVNRLVFCLFADDVALLPGGMFKKMLAASRKDPESFAANAGMLFQAMAHRGGRVGFEVIPWFNGGLFDDGTALPLEGADIALLLRVEELDWGEIDPSILGTLFERGLDPDKRSQLGAHYTAPEMIERLVGPVVREPLLAEWAATREAIEAALEGRGTKLARERRASALLRGFLDRVRAFRVLDPACGSGNFLYLSLRALKDIEHRAMVEAEALGLQREFPQVGPEAVLGIEINPYAAELARVSVWIGHIQWMRRHGFAAPLDPVLRPLETIACMDAVLSEGGGVPAWPTADAIIGNPPFLGDKAMKGVLGDDYVTALREVYEGTIPRGSDLVCYWFERVRAEILAGRVVRAGLVGTNSIRGGANRRVLDRIADQMTIYEAWSDEPWTLDGAAVRVSLVAFAKQPGNKIRLDGREVSAIFSDLTAGDANLTTAKPLAENAGVAFNGIQKTGPFEVDGELARQWLSQPANPNGRTNSEVVKPYWNGIDATRRLRDSWIVDFGASMPEQHAAYFVAPFAHLARVVKPVREQNSLEPLRRLWWRQWRPRAEMRTAIAKLSRFIVTPEVSKHRVFLWMLPPTLPDKNLIVIARDDDTAFGILHSRFHEIWALRLGTWLGVGNDPRYTPSTTFETFPFPERLTPNLAPREDAAIADAARALVAARQAWLNPPDLVERVPEIAPGFPDRMVPRDAKAEATLRKRTLTALYNQRGMPEGAWLDALHARLDAAVAAAYGWPADITDDDALARLLALNRARAG